MGVDLSLRLWYHNGKGILAQNKFKALHEGRTKTEEFFWNHSLVIPLKEKGLVSQDNRFCGQYYNTTHRFRNLDFSLPNYKINIEFDGWGHDSKKDLERDNWLKEQNWKVLRFKNKDVENNIELIISTIDRSL